MADLTNIFSGGFSPLEKIISNTELADPVSAFIDAAREAGIEIDKSFSPDGEIYRYPDRNSKRSELDGWAVLHLDGPVPVGVYGSFKGGGWEQKWTANIGRDLSMQERIKQDQWLSELKRRREEAKKQTHEDSARKAEEEVGSLADAADDHPYLLAKRIKSYGIKIDRSGRLVIPIMNSDGEIQSYQRITAEGNKRFLLGGKIDGGFYEIRGSRSQIYVCEGFATGASIFEATGCSVFVSFNAGNLFSVARATRSMFPAAQMFIAADNDQFTDGNPGITKARVAAHEARAKVVYPRFDDHLLTGKPTDFNDLMCLSGIDAVRVQIGAGMNQNQKHKFELTQVGQLVINDVDYVIDGHLEADSLDLIFGEPGCGKSFISIDMACCVATGTPWHGHPVKQGPVIYIAGEGHNGLAKRFRAWSMLHGVSLDDAPLYKSHRAAQLYDMSVAIDVAEAVQAIVDQYGCPPRMIIIDTVARNMGGDENSTQDMNQFIENIDSLLRHPYKCAVLLVHHSGKASPGQARGSTALRGALDAEYQVEMDQSSKLIRIANKKMKDGDVPLDKQFSIKQIGLNVIGESGNEIVGAALETVDISGLLAKASEAKEFLGKNQRIAMGALDGLFASREIEEIEAPITIDDWKESCRERGIDRGAFRDLKDGLVAKKKISINSIGIITIVKE